MVEGFRYKRAKFKTARILRTEECGVESLVIISLSGTSNQPELRILTGYLLYQVPGVRTESRRGTLEALNPLYGVVNGEKELEHGVTCQTEILFLQPAPTDFIKNSGWKYVCFCFIFSNFKKLIVSWIPAFLIF